MVQMREGRRILCALSLLLAAALSMGTDPATAQQAQLEGAIIAAPRISPQDAYRQVTSGQAVLVCAYEDEAKCNAMMLQGAISLAPDPMSIRLPVRQSNTWGWDIRM